MRSSRRSPWAATLRAVLALYVVLGLVAAIGLLTFGPSPPFDTSASSPALDRLSSDPAGSTSRFNRGAKAQEPSWDADDFLDAVQGHDTGGQIVRMPGAETYLDDNAVAAAIAGTDIIVVVTPPTPLGAVERTRQRDNAVQHSWASKRGLTVIMVHGQSAYLPGPHLYVRTTPPGGIPMREGLRTGDMTSSVIYVAEESIKYADNDDTPRDYPPGTGATTAAALALTDTRAPTAAELSPIVEKLDSGSLYVDPSIKRTTPYAKAWAGIAPGKTLKVVVLPYAAPGPAVDYASALHATYPRDAILVMTGKWIESAGVDRQTVIDAIIQTYGLGGFALAEASQAHYGQILDWVTNIAAAATGSQAFARPLPVMPESGFPRWASYLLLTTSLIIAAGFMIDFLLARRSQDAVVTETHWRDRLSSGFAACYLDLSTAPYLDEDGSLEMPQTARHLLDKAYADLIVLRDIDVKKSRQKAIRLTNTIWDSLDEAARKRDRPESGPTQTIPTRLRDVPAFDAAKKNRSRRNVGKQVTRWIITLAIIGGLVGGFALLVKIRDANLDDHVDTNISALATSSVMTVGTQNADISELQHIIGDRGMLVAVTGKSGKYNFDLAYNMAKNYPDAVVFVIKDGSVDVVQIGSGAQEGSYDKYALIEDYSGLQNESAGNAALVRQLALLYDRLAAEGSIDSSDRTTYDPPSPPWGWIAAGLAVSLAATGLLIRTATAQAVARYQRSADELGAREALTVRLAGISPMLLDAHDSGTDAGTARLAELSSEYSSLLRRVDTSEPEQLDRLRHDVADYAAKVRDATANDSQA